MLGWVEDQINDETVFPTSAATPYPPSFPASIKQIFTRLFRIFAIVYSNHVAALDALDATAHLNTSFKHFLYFVWQFDLVEEKELDALKDLVAEVRTKYLAT